MKYRGYTLKRQYFPGADFRMVNGVTVARRFTKADLDHVRITTPWGFKFNEPTIKLAKQAIDRMEALK